MEGSINQKSAASCRRIDRIVKELKEIRKNTYFADEYDCNITKCIELLKEFRENEEFHRAALKNKPCES